MPGLADLILSSSGEADLEDDELARELAELQAKRRDLQQAVPVARGTGEGSSSRPATGVGSVSQAPTGGYAAVEAVASASSQSAAKQTDRDNVDSVAPNAKSRGRSLADEILSCGVDVDGELKAMDLELEKHLSAYKQQRECAPDAIQSSLQSAAAGAASAPSTEVEPQEEDFTQMETTAPDVQVPPELANLRAEATRLAEAFPDAPEGEFVAPHDLRETRRRIAGREAADRLVGGRVGQDLVDTESLELREALDGLDLRLRTLQKQQELYSDRGRVNVHGAQPTVASKAISEIRAQNDHLRERMKETLGNGGRGVLQIDRSLFVKVAAAPAASSTPKQSEANIKE